jgi:formiminoglutamase
MHQPIPRLVAPLVADDHVLGMQSAAVTVVEYGDFQCPRCKQAVGAVDLMLARFEHRVRFAFRHFPLEEIHDRQTEIVKKVIADNKRMVILGGGNDISYPDGRAMSEVFTPNAWIGVNIDSHLDVRADEKRKRGTPYRQLLEEKLLRPDYFYEAAYQTHFCSPVYYNYIRDLGVNRISLELLRSRHEADLELKESIKEKFIGHSTSMNTFFGFDMDAVRMADAPGTSAPSPLGLKAGEFIQLVKYAASLANTRIIEFTEVNPNFDIDNRTAKLVAIGMHRFCSGVA